MHWSKGLFYAPSLLLLLGLPGRVSSTHRTGVISIRDMITLSDGSIQGFPFFELNSYSGYICGTSPTPNNADAKVICHQYGYASGVLSYASLDFSPVIVMKNPYCIQTESIIMECQGSALGSFSNYDCLDKVYKVTCSGQYRTVTTTVRLYNGISSGSMQWSDGIVQWSDGNGIWHAFCSESWTKYDAQVVCRQLGYSVGDKGVYGLSASIWTNAPNCGGGEIGVETCPEYLYSPQPISSSCTTGTPGGVICSKPYREYSYNIDLDYLFLDNKWLPICATDMSLHEIEYATNNICRQNGYTNSTNMPSESVSNGFTAYVRAVICTSKEDWNSCTFLLAPTGKGFTCYNKLNLHCYNISRLGDSSETETAFSNPMYAYIAIGVFMGIIPPIALLILYLKGKRERSINQQRVINQQTSMTTQESLAGGGVWATAPGGMNVPPPPSYRSIYQEQGVTGYSTSGNYWNSSS